MWDLYYFSQHVRSTHIRHPWFDMPNAKRYHASVASPSPLRSSFVGRSPTAVGRLVICVNRRRCTLGRRLFARRDVGFVSTTPSMSASSAGAVVENVPLRAKTLRTHARAASVGARSLVGDAPYDDEGPGVLLQIGGLAADRTRRMRPRRLFSKCGRCGTDCGGECNATWDMAFTHVGTFDDGCKKMSSGSEKQLKTDFEAARVLRLKKRGLR